MSSHKLSPSCSPQYATPRSKNRLTRGGQVAAVADALGQPLMPWQRMAADVGLETLRDGSPAFREIVVTVPRQSGKTSLVLACELQRALGLGVPQRIAYTAQSGWDARRKLLDDQMPILEASSLAASVRRIYRGAGSEGVVFKNGSRIDVLASTVSSGHGKTIDLGVIDEAFDDVDDRREQALLPAMVTKPDAQIIVVSTMGTDASVYLNRKVELGRAAALEGRTSGVAYFEWAIPEDADINDPRSWWLGMPALGFTITEAVVAHARTTMTEGEFRRAFGNQRMRSAERLIPDLTWRLACADAPPVAGDLTFAVEVTPDRDWSAIGVGDGSTVELIDYRPGVGWVADRVAGLVSEHGGAVAIEKRAAAGSLIPDLRAMGVQVLELGAGDVTHACGSFFDRLADAQVKVRAHSALDVAVEAVARQPVGDAWRWGRRGSVDISPFMAVTLADASARGSGAAVAQAPMFALT